jgi:cyclopropane-fatty-acyl-phospholipid synthase
MTPSQPPSPADATADRLDRSGPAAAAADRLRRAVLESLRKRLQPNPPALRLVFWDAEIVDFAPTPRIVITIKSPKVLRPLLVGNFSKLGDAYVHGDLVVEGRAEDIIAVGVELADRIGRMAWVQRLSGLARHLPRPRSKASDAANIEYHYDVSNDFYRLWLDRNMVYSCAYFRTGEEDIHTAQEQKLDHICRKLALKQGDRLLDIGCGWGGLLIRAARQFGAHGTGITLSKNQYEYARARVAEEGLEGQVEIRLQDYRDVPETGGYDKLVSVGMIEHVGLRNLPVYFAAIARLLKPGGTVLNHGITVTDPSGKSRGPAGGDFIDRYVFPGGELPHISRVIQGMAEAGLEIGAVEDLRPHYARTLIHWIRRLEAAEARAIELAGIEKYRIWKVYMPGMALAFDRGWLTIDQVLAFKPTGDRPAPRPWSLEHVYGADDIPMATGLEWGAPRPEAAGG